MNKDVNIFLKSIEKMAPLKYQDKNYKMPYKPSIVLSIFSVCKNEGYELFNNWIDFSYYDKSNIGTKIIRKHYDIITSVHEVYEMLKHCLNKDMMKNIQIGFNEKTFKLIRNQIFDMPLEKLSASNNFLEVDKKNKKIKFNYQENDSFELINTAIEKSYECLKKSNDFYSKLNLNQILDFDYYQIYKFENNINKVFSLVERRQLQHTYSKKVKDRDGKCLICCEQYPSLLEAAHIKPYKDCSLIEEYDEYNGITLCSTHHKLFDDGYFTFKDDWTVLLSNAKEFENYKIDLDLRFKQFESCFDNLKITKPSLDIAIRQKEYIKYHQDNIFKK